MIKLLTLVSLFFIASTACAEGEDLQKPLATEIVTGKVSGQILAANNKPMPHGIVLLYDKSLGPPPG